MRAGMNLASLVSAARLLLALPTGLLILYEHWAGALIIWLLAACSDLLDGYLARRLNLVTALGGLLDHGADAVFVTSCMFALAHHGIISIWLAPLTALAFISYFISSKFAGRGALQASQFGKFNGVAYYVLCGMALLQSAAGYSHQQPVFILSQILIATTAWMIIAGWRRSIKGR